MVDDELVMCLDRIVIASACIGSFTNSRDERSLEVSAITGATSKESVPIKRNGINGGEGSTFSSSSSSKKVVVEVRDMVECRICQEEDDVHAMEAPCSCNGTLKFAHRKCIQKWCNKKGDITCEICNKVFSPNYTPPQSCSNLDVMTIDLRQAWGGHIDPRDSYLLDLAAPDDQLLGLECEDSAVFRTGSVACLGSVGLIALMLIRDSGIMQGSSKFFRVSLLQFAGFLLSCYVMARSLYMVQSRRRRQDIEIRP